MLSDKLQDPYPFADIQRDTSRAGPIHIMVRLAMIAGSDDRGTQTKDLPTGHAVQRVVATFNRAFRIEFSVWPCERAEVGLQS